MFHDRSRFETLLQELQEKMDGSAPDEIQYYGTGVIGSQTRNFISRGLGGIFPHADIQVNTDLMAAVKVTCGNESGIVTILGTGSNACLWDGSKLISRTPSLGYLIGDEGSGCDIGKHLCRDYYYNRLPDPLVRTMAELLPDSRASFLQKLKSSHAPNRYLASFGQAAVGHRDHPYVQNLVKSRFRKFFEYHIQVYDPKLPLHGVGSVAFGFRKLFNSIASESGYQTGKIIKQPITGLINEALKRKKHGK